MTNKFNVLTADWLSTSGWKFDKAEHWNAFARVRKDLFGFADYVAVKKDVGILAVQSTDASNHSTRKRKILSIDAAYEWVMSGGKILLISWRQGPVTRMLSSGKISTKLKWIPRPEYITREDFETEQEGSA